MYSQQLPFYSYTSSTQAISACSEIVESTEKVEQKQIPTTRRPYGIG